MYSVFFATSHSLGSDRMKKAVWKVAPFGDFSFRGGTSDQMVMLGVAEPDFTLLGKQLQDRFGDAGWVRVGDILEFVRSDETIFHDGQVKKPVLKPMEQEGLIEVDPATRTRRLTHPNGCLIRFRLPNVMLS